VLARAGEYARCEGWYLMTTLQMPVPVSAEEADAQEARWDAWKSKGAAADRITQRRMRILAALLIAAVGVTIAVVL
jgi:hypothetical protein